MDYVTSLSIHSIMRWLVLASLLYMTVRGYQGWLGRKTFTKTDNFLRHTTATIAHIQLMLGLYLYLISPHVKYFLQFFKEAVHEREARFFGMEHIFMMVVAIMVLTIGSAKAKRAETDQEKFKTIAIWFSITLFIIFCSIPWSWSPFSPHRPYWRSF